MTLFSKYLRTIARMNNLGHGPDVEWLFYCGMLFSSPKKWWGDFKWRSADHEGIDITFYRQKQGKTNCFDPCIKVPAMDDGILINICNDYLGKSLVIEHNASLHFQKRVLFVYAHITPSHTLTIGSRVTGTQEIATVCHTRKNTQLPPHLHFSCFEVERHIQPVNLNWDLFSIPDRVNLIHPVFL